LSKVDAARGGEGKRRKKTIGGSRLYHEKKRGKQFWIRRAANLKRKGKVV